MHSQSVRSARGIGRPAVSSSQSLLPKTGWYIAAPASTVEPGCPSHDGAVFEDGEVVLLYTSSGCAPRHTRFALRGGFTHYIIIVFEHLHIAGTLNPGSARAPVFGRVRPPKDW